MEQLEKLAIFQQHRSLLFSLSYRMLGSVTEAEDMVQEAWIRWQVTSTIVKSPKAFLCSLITRLCIDRLRYLRREREKYIGIWLPEPLVNQHDKLEISESLSYAFLVLLECLSPTERAVFILREIFDYEYSQIASIIDKSIPNCRQIFHRARKNILVNQSKFNLSRQEQNLLVEQFLIAWNQGDLNKLLTLMTKDATFYSDGGGKVTAAEKPLCGHVKIARFLLAIKRSKLIPDFYSQVILVNNQIGILNTIEGQSQSIFSFHFIKYKISTIFAIANPDKLAANYFK
ncbi:MAG: RNA polymerase sigma-70 factor [Cyanobacteria bacterium P01_A01_bin.83]